MRDDQAALDASLFNGEPQVLALAESNFLALGKIHQQEGLYVGYDIEATPRGTRKLRPRDHRVRQLTLGQDAPVPLERPTYYPYQLTSGAQIPMVDTVVEVVVARFREDSDHSRDRLSTLVREAVESVVAAGLWSAQSLGYEMDDYAIVANGRDGSSVRRDGLTKAVLNDISAHFTVVTGIQLIGELET